MSQEQDLMLLQNRIEAHILEFNQHVDEEHVRWEQLIKFQENNTAVQERNNEAVTQLTVAVASQVESTKDIIEAWEAANGAIKVGRTVSHFLKWLSGFAFIGIGAMWLLDKLKG